MAMSVQTVRLVLSALFVLACASSESLAVNKHEVFLPPDTDVLTVTGKGFKLELSQFNEISKTWQAAAQSSAEVSSPKTMGQAARGQGGDEEDQKRARELQEQEQQKQQQRQQEADKMTRRIMQTEQERLRQDAELRQDYGPLNDELERWISVRATALIDRLDRYSDELTGAASTDGERVVLEILQLNTISQLEDLVAEQLPALAWLQKKLTALANQRRYNKQEAYRHVSNFAWFAMHEIVGIETTVKGTNDPGRKWLRYAVALKRISNEQRFAEALDRYILDFLARDFSMMKRSIVLSILQGTQQIDTGLVYWAAKRRVSPDFPFSAQDAIANGALY